VQVMKIYGDIEVQLHLLSTSEVDVMACQFYAPLKLHAQYPLNTRQIGSRTGLGSSEKKWISYLCWEQNLDS